MSNRRTKQVARQKSHIQMMTAFRAYLDKVEPRPLEDGQRMREILAAFKAGWNARNSE